MDAPVREVLRVAGLRYSRAEDPGLARRGSPDAFFYVDARGRRVRHKATLERIRKLAIPPAWTQVWICADADGHLQATGRDVRGRKQYRYHQDWRAQRDQHKFHRLVDFASALPTIRAAVDHDLALPGLPRDKVLAAMVSVIDRTFVRVGDERYRRQNGSYGLTTLRNRHVEVAGDRIRIRFRGKSGKEHDIALSDKRLAGIIRHCLDLPGYELFQYVEDGERRPVYATDINAYLQEVSSTPYTAKDFRTWGATVIAIEELSRAEMPASLSAATRVVNDALRKAAQVLGNTLAVCRKSYVHPGVVKAYLDGTFRPGKPRRNLTRLRAAERRALLVLQAIEKPAPMRRLTRAEKLLPIAARKTSRKLAEALAA
ncbi:MAG TPA: DNA topoisomerase IB [Casimicrobiaceae bacterium]|nr:DNA topoisomerase IB [Casimicrobiaceae bacterium]